MNEIIKLATEKRSKAAKRLADDVAKMVEEWLLSGIMGFQNDRSFGVKPWLIGLSRSEESLKSNLKSKGSIMSKFRRIETLDEDLRVVNVWRVTKHISLDLVGKKQNNKHFRGLYLVSTHSIGE